jgi:hypothetical protein
MVHDEPQVMKPHIDHHSYYSSLAMLLDSVVATPLSLSYTCARACEGNEGRERPSACERWPCLSPNIYLISEQTDLPDV